MVSSHQNKPSANYSCTGKTKAAAVNNLQGYYYDSAVCPVSHYSVQATNANNQQVTFTHGDLPNRI